MSHSSTPLSAFRIPHSAFLCAFLFIASPFASAQMASSSPQEVAQQLATAAPQDLATALSQIDQRLLDQPLPTAVYVRIYWIKPLLAGHHSAEALALAQAAILAAPQDTGNVEWLERQRVLILLDLHHNDEALAAAKSLFNVCPPQNTDAALLLLAECLNASRGNESGAVDRLVAEQRTGPTSPTLREIPVNPAPYQAAIRKLHLPSGDLPVNAQDLLGLGNLYLLADQPTQALTVFHRLQTSVGPDQLRNANDALARALRAQDGAITRANAFAASLTR